MYNNYVVWPCAYKNTYKAIIYAISTIAQIIWKLPGYKIIQQSTEVTMLLHNVYIQYLLASST